jgi:hypothetical protein
LLSGASPLYLLALSAFQACVKRASCCFNSPLIPSIIVNLGFCQAGCHNPFNSLPLYYELYRHFERLSSPPFLCIIFSPSPTSLILISAAFQADIVIPLNSPITVPENPVVCDGGLIFFFAGTIVGVARGSGFSPILPRFLFLLVPIVTVPRSGAFCES